MITIPPDALADIAWFKKCLANQALVDACKRIMLVISDVDGTLTDAGIYVDQTGEGGRIFSIQDGYIVRPAQKVGIIISFMSGKDNASTRARAKALNIPEELCATGLESKPASVKKVQALCNVTPAQTLIFGDDILDADVKAAGAVELYACPANTVFYLQQLADLHIPRNGGDGAFRLLMDFILYVQNKHFAAHLIDQCLKKYI